MRDLQERLNAALTAVDPSPAPLDAAKAQGKKIRNRQRSGVLAGAVAVVAAAAVAVPVLTHHEALPSPAARHVRVTVNPPGPHAPAGTIASGLIGTKPWNIKIESATTRNCAISGAGLSMIACNGTLPEPDAADPIGFDGTSGSINGPGTGHVTFYVSFGIVRPDVVSARVLLGDGEVLTLRPATVDGKRWVAFPDPAGVRVQSLTAYSRTGEIATAIPFTDSAGSPLFGEWLGPGQAVPGRLTVTIGSGTVNGTAWKVTAYVGPWGTCIGTGTGSYGCFQGTATQGTWVLGGAGGVWYGSAADSVSSVVITEKNGATTRAGIAPVGPQKYWAVALSEQAANGAHWTAYDAAGKRVASGSLQ